MSASAGYKITLPAASTVKVGYEFEVKNSGPEILTVEAGSESFF